MMIVHVECYDGYRAQERPLRFFLGTTVIEVIEIIDSWQGEDHRYFKIHGNDGNTYILRYDEENCVWELVLFNKGNTKKFTEFLKTPLII